MGNHTGEFAALATTVLWTVTALSFEQAAKRIGSLAVNILRLSLALVFYCFLSIIRNGHLFPTDIDLHGWVWLSVSGIIGFVLLFTILNKWSLLKPALQVQSWPWYRSC
ncbi:MAG: EamA family transporter [Bacteroidales bacterium]